MPKGIYKRKREEILKINLTGMEKTTRNWDLKIRLSQQEKIKVEELAKKIGLKASQYVRVCVLNSKINVKMPEIIIL